MTASAQLPDPTPNVCHLTAAQRRAIVACHQAGSLSKLRGRWLGSAGGRPVCGVTVADLARDGMMTVTVKDRWRGGARLTERGTRYALALMALAESADAALELVPG